MEALIISLVVAAMVWLKAFRYMAFVLMLGIGAYQASLFTSITMQPHLVIAFALATLVGTLVFQLISHKAAKEGGK